MRIHKLIFFKSPFLLFIALTFSCTIIQDSDIKSPEEYSKLKLKSFQIVQNLNEGTYTTDLQVTLGANGKISTIHWPDLGGHKLRFRTPISGSAVSILTYNGAGYLTSFDTQVNSVSVERYTFDYDASGNFITLVSTGSFGTITDVLTYTAGVLSKITRSTTNSTITIDSYGSLSKMDNFQLGGICGYTQDTSLGGNYNNTIASRPNSICIRNLVSFNIPQSVSFTDYGVQQNNVSRDPDIYYFHPFMLTKEYFMNYKPLLATYFRDWWKLGATSNFNFKNDETVTINFVYGN